MNLQVYHVNPRDWCEDHGQIDTTTSHGGVTPGPGVPRVPDLFPSGQAKGASVGRVALRDPDARRKAGWRSRTSAHSPVTFFASIKLKFLDTRLFLRRESLRPRPAASTSNIGVNIDIKCQTLRRLVADALNRITRIRDGMTNNKTRSTGKNNKENPIIDTERKTLW